MAHFGAVCELGTSHVAAMAAIGLELQARGHRVTLFRFADLLDPSAARGLEFWPLDVPVPDFGSAYMRRLSGARDAGSGGLIEYMKARAHFMCEHGPRIISAAKLDCLLVDLSDPAAATVSEKLGLPFVSVGNALPLHAEPGIPPDFLPWQYRNVWWASLRNRLAYGVRNLAIRPVNRTLNKYRSKWGLRPYRRPEDSFSPLAQISQLVREFDLPRQHLPKHFHYVGPYNRASESKQPFPYEKLDGRPLVYASLGTHQGHRGDIWKAIAEGCAGLDVQLVLALGQQGLSGHLNQLPGDPIVVDYAPQRELLARAALAILHGGLNGALESLATGVPMIIVPLTGDQFGVAERVRYSGTGTAVGAKNCTARVLRKLVGQLLGDTSYRQAATRMISVIVKTPGAGGAAAITEAAARTGKPVIC